MSRLVLELEGVLTELIGEHRRLLKHTEAQQAAMRKMDLDAMDQGARNQEASRMRLATLETKRRMIVAHLAKQHNVHGNLKVKQIAELYPARASSLMNLRQSLQSAMADLAARNQVAGKLAGAVVGHLNTVMRLLAGAVDKAGLYTRQGVPQVSGRIGVMNAVG